MSDADAGFESTAARSAYAAAAVGFLYSLSFVVVSRANTRLGSALTGLLLLSGALLGTVVFVALHGRLRRVAPGVATWALGLGLLGAAGSMGHGGFDLANALHPPSGGFDVPFPTDPRGLMTFGLTGVAVLVFSRLLSRETAARPGLAYIGYANGVLMLVLYVGRLVILDATNPLVVVVAVVEGFIVNPLWFMRIGSTLARSRRG